MSQTRIERTHSSDGSVVTERTFSVEDRWYGQKETLVNETVIENKTESPGMSGAEKAAAVATAITASVLFGFPIKPC
jgi:hypothetical protein